MKGWSGLAGGNRHELKLASTLNHKFVTHAVNPFWDTVVFCQQKGVAVSL
jgi:hypothetical protein